MADILNVLAANSRFARLEEANRYADGPRAAGGAHRPAMRLHAAPRALAANGSAAAEAWEIAADGIGNATAYLAPEIGGWHWVAVLGSQDLGHGGAVLLTIGPDGARWAERYGSEPEAWGDMEWIAAKAEDDRECATPAQFAAILDPALEPVAVLEPVAAMVAAPVAAREPLQWVAAVAAMVAQPVAPVAAIEPVAATVAAPVAAPVGRWQRVRWWVLGQVAAMVNPWLGHGFEFELPHIVNLSDLEPVAVAAPLQPGRVRGWVADQVAAMTSPWLAHGLSGERVAPKSDWRRIRRGQPRSDAMQFGNVAQPGRHEEDLRMTYRERREAKAERLRGWAEKREQSAGAVLAAHEIYRGDIAFNTQPGRIPLRSRVIAQDDRAFESLRKAGRMASRADGIQSQLAGSIYSDDPDAIEQLRARIDGLEAERDRVKAYNATCRKGARDISILDEKQQREILGCARIGSVFLGKGGAFPGYHLTNLSGNIARNRQRLEVLKRQQQAAAAEVHSARVHQGAARDCRDCFPAGLRAVGVGEGLPGY